MFKKNDTEPQRHLEKSLTVHEDAVFPTKPGFHGTPSLSSSVATIGETMKFKGELYGDEDVVIQGNIEGKINLPKNTLTIGEQGTVNATVDARSIVIYGSVSGELNCSEQLVLYRSGRVTGNIVTPRVTLEDGCHFKGSIDMENEEEKPSMDNVSSLSLHTEAKKTGTNTQ